jgi:hypothetical protein
VLPVIGGASYRLSGEKILVAVGVPQHEIEAAQRQQPRVFTGPADVVDESLEPHPIEAWLAPARARFCIVIVVGRSGAHRSGLSLSAFFVPVTLLEQTLTLH